jgi:hypothetical protein
LLKTMTALLHSGPMRTVFSLLLVLLSAASAFVADSEMALTQRRTADEYKYVIDDPNIQWSGYRIEMDYSLSAPSSTDNVQYAVYSDKYCQGGLISEEEIEPSLVTSNGSVRLSLLLNPYKINGKRYVSYEDTFATINICVRLWVTGADAQTLSDPHDKYVIIKADLKEMTGIEAILDDKSKYWGVDVYHCDDRHIEVMNPVPIVTNGEKFRLCIKPTKTTTDDGIFLARIHSFRFERGDVIQTAVTPYEIDEVTEVSCDAGSAICILESVLSNEFFWSTGEVKAEGSIFLQFGRQVEGGRRLLRQPVQIDLASSLTSRSLIGYKPGEIVGSKPGVSMIKIDPNDNEYSAEAFRCDVDNNPIPMKEKLRRGQQVKICVQPNFEASRAGVFMNSIESFSYGREHDDLTQVAIDSKGHGSDDGSTQVDCSSGRKICSFQTMLGNDFFTEGAQLVISGIANLQFGAHQNQRQQDLLQSDDAWRRDDLGFAGRSAVDGYFGIVNYRVQKDTEPFTILGLNPTQMKILYATVGLLLGLCLLCCLLSCCFMCRGRRRRKEEEKENVPSNISYEGTSEHQIDSRSASLEEERTSGFDEIEPDDREYWEERSQMSSNVIPKDRSARSRSTRSRDTQKRKKNGSARGDRSMMNDYSDSHEASENGEVSTTPRETDVCFDADEHPGTEAFLDAVRQTIAALGPVPYSPAVYKSIKRQVPGRRFFVCDDYDDKEESDTFSNEKEYEWRQVEKRELVDLFWKYYEEEKVADAVRMN